MTTRWWKSTGKCDRVQHHRGCSFKKRVWELSQGLLLCPTSRSSRPPGQAALELFQTLPSGDERTTVSPSPRAGQGCEGRSFSAKGCDGAFRHARRVRRSGRRCADAGLHPPPPYWGDGATSLPGDEERDQLSVQVHILPQRKARSRQQPLG